MIKKIFIFSSIGLIFVFLLWGIYNFSFNKSNSSYKKSDKAPEGVLEFVNKKNDEQKNIVENFSLGQKLFPLVSSVDFFVVEKDGKNLIYFSRSDNLIGKISIDGKEKKILDERDFSDVSFLLWSPQGDKAFFKANGNFYFYDINSRQAEKIKDNIGRIIWSNLGDKIIYSYYEAATKRKTLNISDPNGNNWKEIAEIPNEFFYFSPVPQSSLISFWPAPQLKKEAPLEIVSFMGGEKKEFFSGKKGADYLWSPNGKKALVSFLESEDEKGFRINLGVIDEQGNFKSLFLPTFVSKCVWSSGSQYAYCALPVLYEPEKKYEDYMSGKEKTKDTFWKIDTSNGKKERILEINEIKIDIDVRQPLLSLEEDKLFFINALDEKLYRLSL